MNKAEYNPAFLDEEEEGVIKSLDLAIESGDFVLSKEKNMKEKKNYWKQAVENTEKRRAITLRLQNRDISRLKIMARKRGLPYQTFIASSLHQLASGDLISRVQK